jgi:hypothetical protein
MRAGSKAIGAAVHNIAENNQKPAIWNISKCGSFGGYAERPTAW